jgi:HlyD family secretion protein
MASSHLIAALPFIALTLATSGCKQPAAPPGFQGLVEFDQRVIGFEVAGRIRDVAVHRGQAVKAGDLLARLEDDLAVASRDAIEAGLAAARADVALLKAGARREDVAAAQADLVAAAAAEALARKGAERRRALLRAGAVTRADADKAESDLEQASARRASVESRLALLRRGARPQEIARAEANAHNRGFELVADNERLARYVLRAPSAGMVLDVTVKPGEVASPGTPAVLLADIAHPYADVFIPEGHLGTLQAGARAWARVDALPDAFRGVVEYISPDTEFTPKFLFSERERPNLVVRARVRIDDPGHRLHAGVPVFVQVGQ